MFDYLTVESNIRFFLAFYGVALDGERLESLLSKYGLAAHRGKIAAEASRGMRRKTQMVAALLMRPALLLADEPFDGLDEPAREQWERDVATMASEGGIVVSAVHDLAYLRARSDRVIMLDDAGDGATSSAPPGAAPPASRGTPPRP
jgi:ABC-2 type transport system ATP-binding protein